MGLVTNVVTTYTSSQNDRDVNDYVTNVSPSDTPFFSLIGNTKGMSRKVESVTDALVAANKDNAMIEGDSLTADARPDRTIESNWMQIFKKVISVSGTQEAVIKLGGIKSEESYQVENSFTELATDVEYALIAGTSASGASGTARKLNGLIASITTNTATAVATGATWTGTSDANLTAYEDLLNDMLELGFNTGKKMTHVLVGGTQKRRISKLSTRITRNVDAESKTQILSINTYDSDFGTVSIILDRYVPSTNIVAVNLKMWKVAYLRRFVQSPLGKTNDSREVAIVGELTLKFDTQKAGAKITAS